MQKIIKIKKGLDIRIIGKAEKVLKKAAQSCLYAVKPTNFHGIEPKLCIKPGDFVKAGSVVFYNKHNPRIFFTSPVCGIIKEIVRGERRKILEIIIKPDEQQQYERFVQGDPLKMTREEIIDNLLKSGLWPLIRQRPYAIIANPSSEPKSVFIPCFDTAPLAPDYDFIVQGENKLFQTGINALTKLTKGKINLTLNPDYPASDVFTKAKSVEITYFKGPHPAGVVGVQIHHIDPINKGDIIWYLYPQDVITIGKLFDKGTFDASRIVALTGSEVEKPFYYKTMTGSMISAIAENNVKQGELRYISGNILTGTNIGKQGYLGFYDSQITVIPEGKKYEFFGWALPGFNKYSTSRSFFSWLRPGKIFRMNTNLHGGNRAFVMTGEYEKVLPMDIFPVHLLKAIIAEDIDKIEQLGIYEVAEEELALCEFVCTSKIEVQSIIRKGIELMIKELG
ncbi:MAG: Na(+)-translocating NADH-quinone reductase subunit A [Bacteroidia bacterium]|nr:Na(+)-translocating NADH-quinone reductase subunit A [Bacteroidia bacterium]